MMKFNPLLLTIAFFAISIFASIQTQGQKTIQTDQSVIKQLYDHDHRKCGSDEATERLMNSNPDYAREVQEFKNRMIPALAENGYDRAAAPIIYVPVVVHVIHNGEAVGTGANISDEQVLAQIEVLNLDFSAMNSNYNDTPAQWQDDVGNPEVQFCMAIIDPNGDPTTGITRHDIEVTGTNANNNNIEDEIKPATWWDSDEYYNIYVVGIPGTGPGGGTTGYAYYPTNGMIGSVLDGSVVDYNWFGGPGFGNSGSGTLTHETGHYLGLPHPFDGEDCGDDDMIGDTPNMDAPTSDYNPGLNCSPGNFPMGPVSCGNEHMYVNYMDYVNDDDCSTSFTLEQINVMRGVLEGNPPTDSFPSYGSRFPLTQNATTVCSFFDNDAGITSIVNPTENICGDDMITPMVNLQNFGENNLTTVTISYEINNGTPVDFIWIDNLGTGETQTVDLVPFTPPVGDYTFTVYTNLPNGVVDEQTDNDQAEVTVTTVIPTNIPLFENFEDVQWDPTANGVYSFNTSGDAFVWERTTGVSGFGMGSACATFNNYSNSGVNGTTDALITSVYDFSTVTGASLSFDVAYAPYDNSFFDSLKVFASTDCGSSFSELLYADGNTGLATAPATTGLFTPSSTQWATKNIDLSAYNNTDNLTIAIINQSGYGNRLFIDNINLSAGCSMSLAVNGTDPTCFEQCDGIAGVTISDGAAPFTYLWDANANNSTAETVQNLCAGSYSVTVTDAASCTAEVIVELTDPAPIVLTVSHTNETAPNANDGTATVVASGGTGMLTYLWSNSASTETITNLTPGTYSVIITDINGCAETDDVIIEEVPCTITLDPVETNLVCNGICNGVATVVITNGTAPYIFAWDANANNSTDSIVADLCAGFYTVTVTDANDCSTEIDVEITEPAALDLMISTTNVTTNGGADGTATAGITGGTLPYAFLWNDSGAQVTETASGLIEGTYCVTVTDGEGCSVEGCKTVAGIDCSSFSVSVEGQDISCFGFQNGEVSAAAENGTMPYSYEWNTGDDTAVVTGLNEGTYTVTATDAQDCTSEGFITINEPEFLSVIVICTDETTDGANDGTCTATHTGGTGPYTEDWSNGEAGTLTITNLSPGKLLRDNYR